MRGKHLNVHANRKRKLERMLYGLYFVTAPLASGGWIVCQYYRIIIERYIT